MKSIRFKFLALLLSVCCFSAVHAQKMLYGFESKVISKLPTGTLYIVQTGGEEYDKFLEKEVKQYWTVTPIEVIGIGDIENKLNNELNYFLITAHYNGVNLNIAPPRPYKAYPDPLHYLMMFRGGYKKLEHVTSASMFYESRIEDMSKKWYTSMKVKVMSDVFATIISKKLKSVPIDPAVSKAYREFTKQNISRMKEKTLVLTNGEMAKLGEHLKKHGIPYEIKTSEEINEMLEQGNKEYCYLVDDIIVDVATKDVLYFSCGPFEYKEKEAKALKECLGGKCCDK